MSEQPVSQPARPGPMSYVITVVLLSIFAVRTARWWAAVAGGKLAVESITTWGWVKIGFYHVAVLAGVAALIGMIRASRQPAPDSTPEPPPPADRA